MDKWLFDLQISELLSSLFGGRIGRLMMACGGTLSSDWWEARNTEKKRQWEAFKKHSSTFTIQMEKQPLFSEGFDEEEKQAYVGPPKNVMAFSSSSPPAKGDHGFKTWKIGIRLCDTLACLW